MSRALIDGSVFAHRYRVVRCIATGGMGSVYEVIHIGTNRRRALKVMHPHLFQSPELRERFKREARVAADIQSEYVVDVFDTGVDESTGIPFLVMELLQGEDLRHRLQRTGRLSSHEVVTYLLQVAAALDKSHAASIVHRDLKPENIFLTHREDGLPLVKVLDFGVAKILAENTSRLQETQGLGTPLFMAPEQLSNEGTVTYAADIHALGMVAYMLLVGTTYWHREMQKNNPYHFIVVAAQGVRESATTRAAEIGVNLPRAFDAWFANMTALRPDDRYAHAGEAIAALEKALGIQYDGPRPKFVAPSKTTVEMPVVTAITQNRDPHSLTNAAALTAAVTTSGTSRARLSPVWMGLAAVTLCALGGGLAGWTFLRPPHTPTNVHLASDVRSVNSAINEMPPPLPPKTNEPSATTETPPMPSVSVSTHSLPAQPPTPKPTVAPKSKTPPKPRLDDLLGQH